MFTGAMPSTTSLRACARALDPVGADHSVGFEADFDVELSLGLFFPVPGT